MTLMQGIEPIIAALSNVIILDLLVEAEPFNGHFT
jgi:hypothetical protein